MYYLFIYSIISSFLLYMVRSFCHLFIPLFICSSVCSFFRSFIHYVVYSVYYRFNGMNENGVIKRETVLVHSFILFCLFCHSLISFIYCLNVLLCCFILSYIVPVNFSHNRTVSVLRSCYLSLNFSSALCFCRSHKLNRVLSGVSDCFPFPQNLTSGW